MIIRNYCNFCFNQLKKNLHRGRHGPRALLPVVMEFSQETDDVI